MGVAVQAEQRDRCLSAVLQDQPDGVEVLGAEVEGCLDGSGEL